MGFSLNGLQASMLAKHQMTLGESALASAVERLSSGLRINRAADNASSLAISEKIQSQISSINQGIRNAHQAISMLQTAEGSLSSASDMLLRMKELAVQGRNASLSTEQRSSISGEIAQLRKEINAIANRTTYNSNSLLKNALLGVNTASGLSDTQLINGAEVLPGLVVENLQVNQADIGQYKLEFGDFRPIDNQYSRITTAFTGLEGSNQSQLATVGGTTSAKTITLSGVFEAGDTIRYTVKGDSPDRTTVLTYTVTAENLTRFNNGFGGVVAGDSEIALTNIASGIAAQYNANNISKPDAVASGAVITFLGSGLSSISVAADAINRVDQSREIIVTPGDLGEGNRAVLTINDKSYEYILASDSTTASVAEGLRQMISADYPDMAVRAGSILTIESGSGLTVADITYKVYQPQDKQIVNSLASVVSDVQSVSVAARTILINDFDVLAGRKFTVSMGNPELSSTYSVIAGAADDKNTIASKLAARLRANFGSGVLANTNTVTFSSALGLGMSSIQLSVSETQAGQENSVVGPAQGITSATWGVGGRLDDGVYEILYSESGWSVVRDPLPGSVSTFNGSVLTTSAGNQVNMTLTGTPQNGDRYFFKIQNGDPDRTLSRTISAVAGNGVDAAMGTTDDTVTPGIWNDTKLVAIGGGPISSGSHALTYSSALNYWTPSGTTYTATYNNLSSTVTVIDNPYRSVSSADFGLNYGYLAGDQISFGVGATGSPDTVTMHRSVGGSFSGGTYIGNVGNGFWDFQYNGSSWIALTGGGSVSGSAAYVSGINVGTLSGGKEGDTLRVSVNSYLNLTDGNWYHLTNQFSSSNDFDGANTFFDPGDDPLVQGSYSFTYNGISWSANGSTPASATYNGSLVQNGSGGTSARVAQNFQIRRAEPLDATIASLATRTPINGDQITITGNTPSYLRVGTTGVRFAVAGILAEGDYTLEYNGVDYSIKNAFGDTVLSAQYTSENGTNWLILDPAGGNSADDRVELDLEGVPQVGDKVYFTLTAGNVITNRIVNGSYLDGREASVSSKFRDRSDRVITISDADLGVGRSVAIEIAGKEYAALVESTDNATSIARKLAGLINHDYPNTTAATQTPEFPAATRISVNNNKITLGYRALTGIDDIKINVRSIINPGQITLSKLGASGTVEGAQAIDIGEVAAGKSKNFIFDQLGVSFSIQNQRQEAVSEATFLTAVSRLNGLNVAALRSSVLLQVGASNRGGDYLISGLSDIRLNGKNHNQGDQKEVFDRLAIQLDALEQKPSSLVTDVDYASLENHVEAAISQVSSFRGQLGVQQNRLEHAISGTSVIFENLTNTRSRLIQADMADEMARLTRIQIGQQAATAVMAQANLLPEVILSMLKASKPA